MLLTADADLQYTQRYLRISNDDTNQIITDLVAMARQAYKAVVVQGWLSNDFPQFFLAFGIFSHKIY